MRLRILFLDGVIFPVRRGEMFTAWESAFTFYDVLLAPRERATGSELGWIVSASSATCAARYRLPAELRYGGREITKGRYLLLH